MLKVISYSVGGKGNKVYYSGEIVSENCFENVSELITKGYLQPVDLEPKKVIEEVAATTEADKPKAFENINVKELKAILVDFPKNATKPVLYDLYVSTFE